MGLGIPRFRLFSSANPNYSSTHNLDRLRERRHRPSTAEYIERTREDVIVDESGVYAERAHQHDHIPTTKEHLEDLVLDTHCLELSFAQYKEQAGKKHDQTVAHVAEHDGEQERERDERKGSCKKTSTSSFRHVQKYAKLNLSRVPIRSHNRNHVHERYTHTTQARCQADVVRVTFRGFNSQTRLFHLGRVLITREQHI